MSLGSAEVLVRDFQRVERSGEGRGISGDRDEGKRKERTLLAVPSQSREGTPFRERHAAKNALFFWKVALRSKFPFLVSLWRPLSHLWGPASHFLTTHTADLTTCSGSLEYPHKVSERLQQISGVLAPAMTGYLISMFWASRKLSVRGILLRDMSRVTTFPKKGGNAPPFRHL